MAVHVKIRTVPDIVEPGEIEGIDDIVDTLCEYAEEGFGYRLASKVPFDFIVEDADMVNAAYVASKAVSLLVEDLGIAVNYVELTPMAEEEE